MIINPTKVIQEKRLSELANPEEQIQQNGVDLTLKSISKLHGTNTLLHDDRSHCDRSCLDSQGNIRLEQGVYEILYSEKFDIPNGHCAAIFTRSTIVRGGNFIASGLYDAGFNNYGGGVLHVRVPLAIELGVRVAQAVFFEAEEGNLYEGVYNNKTSV